MFGRHGPMV